MATEDKLLTVLEKASEKALELKKQRNVADFCEIYKDFRPLLVAALPLISKYIPKYGKLIVTLIEGLMMLADKSCPTVTRAERKKLTKSK